MINPLAVILQHSCRYFHAHTDVNTPTFCIVFSTLNLTPTPLYTIVLLHKSRLLLFVFIVKLPAHRAGLARQDAGQIDNLTTENILHHVY